MSNIVQLNSKRPTPRVTPQEVAKKRFDADQVEALGAWISLDRLVEVQLYLERVFDMVEAVRALPEETQDQIEALGGLDHEAVFDEAFRAHFELSAAEETLVLLKDAGRVV